MRALGWLACAAILSALAFLPAAGATAGAPQPSFTQRHGSLLPIRSLGRMPGASTRATSTSACGGATGVVCSQVEVPLDRTGRVPGSISLHVEVVPAAGTPRGAVFLIAGGPGQGSAHVFGLDDPRQVAIERSLFPGYTLVAYDDRGTGDSGLIDCPAVQTSITPEENRVAATACAQKIGPNREFYSTAEHAEDLEAVRASLGFDKIALYGISYGTKLALAYALAHPDHVERLLLDSVVPPEQTDPYGANDLQNMPTALDAFCSNGSCQSATKNYSADVAAVANRLAAKPYKGRVLLANGKTKAMTLDGLLVVGIVVDSDLSPGLAADLPAAMHAARIGNMQPLLRLAYLRNAMSVMPSIDLSFGLYLATVCRDGQFPWAPETPIGQRQSILNAAVAALPPGSFGPFGSWAYRTGNADTCAVWPSPSGGAALGPGPLPNVPVLAVSGGYDMRTPTTGAADVIARFPQGQLLVVPGVGHDTIDADFSGCAMNAVRAWMGGAQVAGTCPRPAAIVEPVPGFPPPGSVKPKAPFGPQATYAIAKSTIADAEALWLMAQSPAAFPGLFGGKLTPGPRQLTLTRYSISRGVTLTGTIKFTSVQLPLRFQGTLTVAGPSAAGGILGLNGTSLRGSLGGKIVGR